MSNGLAVSESSFGTQTWHDNGGGGTVLYEYTHHLLAVQIANNICIESKKKNITSREIDAPKGKHNACIVSRV
jgi:hypothetical protein